MEDVRAIMTPRGGTQAQTTEQQFRPDVFFSSVRRLRSSLRNVIITVATETPPPRRRWCGGCRQISLARRRLRRGLRATDVPNRRKNAFRSEKNSRLSIVIAVRLVTTRVLSPWNPRRKSTGTLFATNFTFTFSYTPKSYGKSKEKRLVFKRFIRFLDKISAA